MALVNTDAIVLRAPGLADDVETASLLASGKHLLEDYLRMPLILRPTSSRSAVT